MIGLIKSAIGRRAIAVTERREPDFIIGPTVDDPYMLRWWWIPRNRIFNVYIHMVLHDDDDRALHDHPWPSLSLMVQGRLREVYQHKGQTKERMISAGALVFRRAKFAHRLELPGKSAITVFVTGPRIREWGFLCPKGWTHWKDFVAKDHTGSIGRGCGDV